MTTNISKNALPELKPPRICIILRRASFRFDRVNLYQRHLTDLAKTQQIAGQNTVWTSWERVRKHENDRKWTHMPLPGLRIRPNESPGNFLSIGDPPRPQIPPEKSKINKIRRYENRENQGTVAEFLPSTVAPPIATYPADPHSGLRDLHFSIALLIALWIDLVVRRMRHDLKRIWNVEGSQMNEL